MRGKPLHTALRTPVAFLWNLALAYVVYWLCRVIYWAENASAFEGFWSENTLGNIFKGAWMFDTSAILYTNLPYALLMLIPLAFKERDLWQRIAKWLFILINGLAVVVNLMDAAYFPYTGRRTTASVFSEFSNEGNLGSVFGIEIWHHWYLVLAAILLICLLYALYRVGGNGQASLQTRLSKLGNSRRRISNSPRRVGQDAYGVGYYLLHGVLFLLFVPLCIAGMRGGITTAVRPITLSNANQYVRRPAEAAIILNTPFSLLRTIDKQPFTVPSYFEDEAAMQAFFSPLHEPTDSTVERRKNVVVLILESFGREYIGALNPTLEGGHYKGYTPFVDSLVQQSLTCRYTFANGRKSIDGMPSILSSIPMFVEPFFLTPAALNTVGGLARELKADGYCSAFFHGAENGSMGFQAFAQATGFDSYYGKTEYNSEPRFGGEADFDGMWAIWDEPFLQFFASKMTELQEPFVTSVFTASSHHPFRIPEAYEGTFAEGSLPIHKCIRYTDYALRRFFDTARQQPWYDNTIFVLTADHTNQCAYPEYATALGQFSVPLLFFDPSGEMPRGSLKAIGQQIDIMPTILGWLGHRQPYIAFGCNLLSTPERDTWAVNYNNGSYQFARDRYLLQFDGERPTALFDFEKDWMLQDNLLNSPADTVQEAMTQTLKSIIQQYMERMKNDQLVVSTPSE